jgi:hypothetical protein
MKINNMKINIEEQIDNLDNDIINITNETTEDYLSDLLKLKLDIIDISNERIENHCSDLSKLDELYIEKVNYKQFKYKIDKEYHFRQYQINEFIKKINSIPNDTRFLFLNSGCKYFYHFGFYDFNIFRYKNICEFAVQSHFRNLQYVKDEFKTEKLCKLAVQRDGLYLQYVNYDLQTEEICKIAVQQNGYAIQYVKDEFRREELCELAGRLLKYKNGASEYLIFKLTKIQKYI